MTAASRNLAALASAGVDRDLLAEFLTARSAVTAQLEYMSLSRLLEPSELVGLVNLRELLQDLPTTPFHTGAELDLLRRSLGYTFTGAGYRQRFDNDPTNVFGFEFVGSGTTVQLLNLHTVSGRIALGHSGRLIDEATARMFVTTPAMLDRLLEALDVLGVAVAPPFYLSPKDFVLENVPRVPEDLAELP